MAANRAQTQATEVLRDLRSTIEAGILERTVELDSVLDSLQAAGDPQAWAAAAARDDLEAVGRWLESSDSTLQARLPVDGSEHWRTYRVWQLLLNLDRDGVGLFLTAAALILYNLARAIVTYFMGPMRDEEERSGFTPRYDRDSNKAVGAMLHRRISMGEWWDSFFEAYGWLWPWHRLVSFLWFVAVASFLWHAIDWLVLTQVHLPR